MISNRLLMSILASRPNIGQRSARHETNQSHVMLNWPLTFFFLALIAGVLGFTSVAGAAASIAQVLFFAFLVLLLFSAIHRHERRL